MSICSEHQEKEDGCPRCHAALPDDFKYTGDTLPCPGCGEPVPKDMRGMYCAACLEKAMRGMTAEDWKRELGAICENLAKK